MKNFRGRPLASVTACSLVLSPPFVLPIRRPRWSSASLFRPQARSRTVRLQVGRVDHDGLVLGALGGQPIHHPGKDPYIVPPIPSVVERLRRPILTRRIASAQPITIDEDYPTQNAPIVHPWLAMAPWDERLQTLHLLVGQPEYVAQHHPRQFRSMNHAGWAASSRLMRPDPKAMSAPCGSATSAP